MRNVVFYSLVATGALASAPSLAQNEVKTHFQTGPSITSPFEFQAFSDSFAFPESPDWPSGIYMDSDLLLGRNDPAGAYLLERAATGGDADAALALGIAADKRGDLSASFFWLEESAKQGSVAGSLLAGRAQLYGLGTPQDFDSAIIHLEQAYDAGFQPAAAELAIAAAYGWSDTLSPDDAPWLWTDALAQGDGLALPDYASYLNAGGAAVDGFSVEEMVLDWAASDRDGAAVLSWDIARDFDFTDASVLIDSLEAAHAAGDLDATARLGEALLLKGDAAAIDYGLGYLFQAADAGKSIAYTAIGEHYLNHPDEIGGRGLDYAIEQLNRGLALGDIDASAILAEQYLQQNDYRLAFDYALLNLSSGTEHGQQRANAVLDELCVQDDDNCQSIVVAFATSRLLTTAPNGQIEITDLPSAQYEPTFGFAEVRVPVYGAGAADKGFDFFQFLQSILPFNQGAMPADPFKDSEVNFTTVDGWDTFRAGIETAARAENTDQVLVYVHGVHTSFRGALTAAASLKGKANLPGIPIVYAWPAGSAARPWGEVPTPRDYMNDVNNAERTCTKFQRFLVDITQAFASENTNFIAYSHGGKLLANGLTMCGGAPADLPRVAPVVRNVVYAAPDIDSLQFSQIAGQIVNKASRVTLYASNADVALYLSGEFLSGDVRAGMGGPRRTLVEGVDTVDFSSVATVSRSSNPHDYLFVSPAVLQDLSALIGQNSPPEKRCLQQRPQGDDHYWEFKELCAPR